MAIDQSLIDKILQAADIVQVISSYIPVIKKGRNYVAVCPFHDDKNPSLQISPEKRIFKCFACGTGGNAITFVEKYEKIPFIEALRKVADMVGIHDERLMKKENANMKNTSHEPLYRALKDLSDFYHYSLRTSEGKIALDYLNQRQLKNEIQETYALGYAPTDGIKTIQFLTSKGHSLKTIDDIGIAHRNQGVYSDRNHGRVIFPIMDKEGRVIGFSARRLSENKEEAKYVNSPETPLFHKANVLFNYHIARQTARHDGFVYVLEGFMDVFALTRIGITSCVALMGTALTKEHIRLLRSLNCEIRLCLDGDEAGQNATMKIISLLDQEGLTYRIVSNQNNPRDPDEILREDGKEALERYLQTLLNRAEFALSYYKKSNTLTTLEERKKLIYDFLPILLATKSLLELEDYFLNLQAATRFPIEEIRALYVKMKKKASQEEKQQIFTSFRPERKKMQRLQFAEKEILYQMMHEPEAFTFYQENIAFFYDEVYHQIANFMVEYYEKYDKIDVPLILSYLEQSDLPEKESMVQEMTSISLEKTHPPFSISLMNDCWKTIQEERKKIFEKQKLEDDLKNKTPMEKAEIIATYQNQKAKE